MKSPREFEQWDWVPVALTAASFGAFVALRSWPAVVAFAVAVLYLGLTRVGTAVGRMEAAKADATRRVGELEDIVKRLDQRVTQLGNRQSAPAPIPHRPFGY